MIGTVWPVLWAFFDDWALSRVSACSRADVSVLFPRGEV